MPFSDEKNGQPTGQKYADLNKLSLTKGAKITNIFCQYKQTVPSHFLSTTKELQALKKKSTFSTSCKCKISERYLLLRALCKGFQTSEDEQPVFLSAVSHFLGRRGQVKTLLTFFSLQFLSLPKLGFWGGEEGRGLTYID